MTCSHFLRHTNALSFYFRGDLGLRILLFLWCLLIEVILYPEPLEGNYSTGQFSQFQGTVYIGGSCAHLGHFVDFQLQGLCLAFLL